MAAGEGGFGNPLKVIGDFLASTIGAKVMMGLTGIFLGGFVLQHMIMNLQVLMPAPADGYWGQQINDYAHGLKSLTPLLWGGRAALLLAAVLHIYFGIRLTMLNKQARPHAYAVVTPKRSTILSRLMHISGLVVLGYLVLHILHFTIGLDAIQPGVLALRDDAGQHDVYNMVRDAFRVPWIVVVYVACNALIVGHLWHGFTSALQTLGLNDHRWTPALRLIAQVSALGILAGNLTMPLVLFYWHTLGS